MRRCVLCRKELPEEGEEEFCEECLEHLERRDGWLTRFCDFVPREPQDGRRAGRKFPEDFYWPGGDELCTMATLTR